MAWLVVIWMFSLLTVIVASGTTPAPGHWECQKDAGKTVTSCDFEKDICSFEQGVIFPGNVEWRRRNYNSIYGMDEYLNKNGLEHFMTIDNNNTKAKYGSVGHFDFYFADPKDGADISYLCLDFMYATQRHDKTPLPPNAPATDHPHIQVQWSDSMAEHDFGKPFIAGDTDLDWKQGHVEYAVKGFEGIIISSKLTPDKASINIDKIRLRHGVWVLDPITTTQLQPSQTPPNGKLQTSTSLTPTFTPTLSLKISSTTIHPCTTPSILETSISAFSCIDTVTVSVCPSKTTSIQTNTPAYHSSPKPKLVTKPTRRTSPTTSTITTATTKTTTPAATTTTTTTTTTRKTTTTTKTTTATPARTTTPTTTRKTTPTTTRKTTPTTTRKTTPTPTTTEKTTTTRKTKRPTKLTRPSTPRHSSATRIHVKPRVNITLLPHTLASTGGSIHTSNTTISSTSPNRIDDDGGLLNQFWALNELTKLIIVACIGGLGWTLFFVCLILLACVRRERNNDDKKKRRSNMVTPVQMYNKA